MGVKISAVLITKNEEKVIERCIKSLRGIDEVVVLDTGSTDNTVQVATDAGAKVTVLHDKIVPFHFSEARSKANALASNEWILTIDADEVLRSGSLSKIKKAIDENQDVTAVAVTFINHAEGDATRTIVTEKTKFFRKSVWYWKYRVHERLMAHDPTSKVGVVTKAVMEHLPIPDKTVRHGQNIELLKLCVQENPEYIRAFRHLGQELMLQKKWSEAIPYLANYAEKTKEDALHKSEALMHIGRCYAEDQRLDEGLKWFDLSNQTDARRREPLYHAALNLIKACRLEEALSYVKRMMDIPVTAKPDSNIDLPDAWGVIPIKMMTFCTSEIARAKAAFEAQRA